MLPESKVQHSFNRALSSYNDTAVVQKGIAEQLVKLFLEAGVNHSVERVFEFGCGTGFLTHSLATQFDIKEFITNDLVEDCQNYIASLPISDDKVSFVAGNVDNSELPNNCDLICSASCVQWSSNPAKLLDRLTQSLKPNGWLGLSSFSVGHFKELATLQAQNKSEQVNQLSYWSEQTWREQLESDYKINVIASDETIVWFNSPKDVLVHLRLTGVNGNAGQPWNQHRLVKFEDDYRSNFEVDGQIPLSYRPIYIVAQKKQEKR